MKRHAILALLVVMLVGCDDDGDTAKVTAYSNKIIVTRSSGGRSSYYVVEIEGCEYIWNYYRDILVHKGNCRRCYERYEDRMKDKTAERPW